MCISYMNYFKEKQKIQLPVFDFKKNGIENDNKRWDSSFHYAAQAVEHQICKYFNVWVSLIPLGEGYKLEAFPTYRSFWILTVQEHYKIQTTSPDTRKKLMQPSAFKDSYFLSLKGFHWAIHILFKYYG